MTKFISKTEAAIIKNGETVRTFKAGEVVDGVRYGRFKIASFRAGGDGVIVECRELDRPKSRTFPMTLDCFA